MRHRITSGFGEGIGGLLSFDKIPPYPVKIFIKMGSDFWKKIKIYTINRKKFSQGYCSLYLEMIELVQIPEPSGKAGPFVQTGLEQRRETE